MPKNHLQNIPMLMCRSLCNECIFYNYTCIINMVCSEQTMKRKEFKSLRQWTLNWLDILQRKKNYVFLSSDKHDNRINKLMDKLIKRG